MQIRTRNRGYTLAARVAIKARCQVQAVGQKEMQEITSRSL